MTLQPQNNDGSNNWKSRIYVLGAMTGTIFGLISAYLYARAAEENTERVDRQPERVGTGQMIALGLAALGLIRQIAELGKPAKKK